MNIEIRPITTEADEKAVYPYQCGYSHIVEGFDDFVRRVKAAPDLYLAAFGRGVCVGICHGRPSDKAKDAIGLEIIATERPGNSDYARKGIGSRLIKEFEKAVRRRGYRWIDVGAAMGVEGFYLKNGYRPYELVATGPNHEEYERVKVKDYESGKAKQEELLKKHKAREVIFILEKTV